MCKVFTPPMNIAQRNSGNLSLFLAGSIENGSANNWQGEVIYDLMHYNIDIFNPRRENWDASLETNFENPLFYQQVNWELNALEKSDIILMYLEGNTKSPISLLELGLFAKSGKMNVVCDDEFWRKGNVDIVCDRYNIKIFGSIQDFEKDLIKKNNLTHDYSL